MEFSKLSSGQKLAVVAGAILLLNLFLPWYGVLGININAFDSGFLAWGGSLIAIAAAVIVGLKATGRADAARGTLAAEQIGLLTGALGFVLIVLRWLTETSLTRYGLFLGMAAAGAVTYGAYLTMKEQGIDMPDMDDIRSITEGDDAAGDDT